MKAYLSIINALNWLVTVAVSAAAILWWAEVELPENTNLQDAKVIAFIAGVVLITLNLIALLVRLRTGGRPHYLIFEKEGAGSLRVAIDAIEETLTKSAVDVPEVTDARIQMILEKGGKMPRKATVHCVFTDVPNIFAIQESVRQLLTQRYQEIFPGEEVNFEIIVDRLKGELPPARRKKPDEHSQRPKNTEEAGQEPFGPKYPIE